jgi:imidazolonepropionase-like amidohydrolase
MRPQLFALVLTLAGSLAAQDLALVGGKAYPSPYADPISDSVVLLHNGKITKVGPRQDVKIPVHVQTIDCSGMYVVAGFQNSHVHFTEPKWTGAGHQPKAQVERELEEMLIRYGFTTVVDTGSDPRSTIAMRERIAHGEVRGPRILTAGTPIYPEHGVPYYLVDALPPEILAILPQPADPQAAAAEVDRHLKSGVDVIKLFTGSWVKRGRHGVKPMNAAVARAAVEEAHRSHKLVFTHPSDMRGLEVALQAHVDVLAHAIEDLEGWNPSYVARMKKAKMAMVPTLTLFSKNSNLNEILDEVGGYARAGGQILFGTDVGYLSDYDTALEYDLMHRAGLDYRHILDSLTQAPADRFREGKRRGALLPGRDADIVVLGTDPAADARAFADVRYTIRGGTVIFSRGK